MDLSPENIKPNTFTIVEVKKQSFDYDALNLDLHDKHEKIYGIIATNRLVINAINDIAKTEEGKSATPKYSIFGLLVNSLYFQLIISSSILFNKNEHQSINKFIGVLSHEHKKIMWKEEISIPDLNILKENLLNGDLNEIYGRLKGIRNQHLAHRDKSPDYNTISIQDLEKLQDRAEELINDLGNSLYGKSTGFKYYHDLSLLELL